MDDAMSRSGSGINLAEINSKNLNPAAASSAFEEMCAGAEGRGFDFGSVLVIGRQGDALTKAFAEEKDCHGIHVVPFSMRLSVNPAWYAAMVDNGNGPEVTLCLTTRLPYRHMFLGPDLKMGVKKACEIMTDRSGKSWDPIPQEN